MSGSQIPIATDYSKVYIGWMRIIRYLQTGLLLHLMAVLGIIGFVVFIKLTLRSFEQGNVFFIVLNSYLTLYFLSLPFFSQLDARSRYRNYKMIKDKFYQYGFDERIVRPFIFSRCQRDAIFIAAKDLNLTKELNICFYNMGFRWYHILPHLVVKNPKILLTKSYWQKTLFVKSYKSRYYLW